MHLQQVSPVSSKLDSGTVYKIIPTRASNEYVFSREKDMIPRAVAVAKDVMSATQSTTAVMKRLNCSITTTSSGLSFLLIMSTL